MSPKFRPSGVSIAIKNSISQSPPSNKVEPRFQVKIASDLKLKKQAFRLAFECYLEKGYVTTGSHFNQYYTTEYDRLRKTAILNVYNDQNLIVGTMSVVLDTEQKIPASKLFDHELNQKRKIGHRIAEVTRLAIDKKFRHSKEILSTLIDHMMAYIYFNQLADAIVIEVHPGHQKFYTGFLGFEQISEEKPCPFVLGSPAVCLFFPVSIYSNSHSPKGCGQLKYYKRFRKLEEARETAIKMGKENTPLKEKELFEVGLGDICLTF